MKQISRRRREAIAEQIADRLDMPVTVAGLVLVVVLVADNLTSPSSPLDRVWLVLGWVLWGLFVAEFLARLIIAPSTWRFLKKNWWQLTFLAVPFLRFLRAFGRGARLARVASTSVRTRTAGRTLAGRVGLVAAVSVGTVLGASELLFTYTEVSYASALHASALGAIAGEPLEIGGTLPDILEIALAIHAAVVFAALAAALGAFFVDPERAAPVAHGGGGRAAPAGVRVDKHVGFPKPEPPSHGQDR